MIEIGLYASARPARRATAVALVLGLSALGASSPARAQFFFDHWWNGQERVPYVEQLPPEVIYRRLARQGYRVTGDLRRNGDVLIVVARDPDDRPMRLIIDPEDGSVLQRFALAMPNPRPRGSVDESNGYDGPRTAYPAYPGYSEPRSPESSAERAEPPAPKRVAPKPRIASRPLPPPPHAPRDAVVTPVKPAAGSSVAAAPPTAAAPRPSVSPTPDSAPMAEVAAKTAPADKSKPATTTAEASPRPAAATAPTANRPGYANGVPINPLD